THANGCETLRAKTRFWIRLSTSTSSYDARPGAPLSGVLLDSPECNGDAVLPVGLPIKGRVMSVRKVGWGIRHETALLELAFDRIVLPDQSVLEIDGRVLEVNNAREIVKEGVIYGIRASDTPQGMINSRLLHLPVWNPYSDWGLIAYKS